MPEPSSSGVRQSTVLDVGYQEDREAERLEWATRYSVWNILPIGLVGALLVAVGLAWRRPWALPGLMVIGIDVGAVLIFWAFLRTARWIRGEREYGALMRRWEQERRTKQAQTEDWQRRYGTDGS